MGSTPPAEPPSHVQGVGSGFFIDVAKGYVVTSHHVVENADQISIRLPTGLTSRAKVIGRDKNTDLAVVQLVDKNLPKDGLVALAFADSDKTRVGDLALALGAPFGLEASLSFGVISATGRGNLGITQLGDFMQTDAAINPGNSGGPLLNVDGQVAGVNTAIFSETGSYAGIGFAVPANMARMVTERLVSKGKVNRGYIGLTLQPLTPELREGLKIPAQTEGALVSNVIEDGPAAQAGLQPGDVITAVNRQALRNETDLINRIGFMEPGQSVDLTYLRGGKEQKAKARLGPWPVHAPTVAGQANPTEGEANDFGITLMPETPELRSQLNLTSRQGAVVTEVRPESIADHAGLLQGDLIVAVNAQPVTSPEDVTKFARGKDHVLIRLERQGTFLFAVLDKTSAERDTDAGQSH